MNKTIAIFAFAAAVTSAVLPARASTFTISGSGGSFTIQRSGEGTNAAETVQFRTVSLSALAGQNYTAQSGTLTFAAGQTVTNIAVSARSPSADAYKYQTGGTTRSYRFDLMDEGGFGITNVNRSVSSGLSQFSAAKVSQSATDLVTFSGSNFSSGMSSGKYLDVSYTPPSGQVETSGTLAGYVLIDDSYDYAQKPATVATSNLISTTGATASYLNSLGYKIHATVCFTEKERDDGYQYLQIVAGNSVASYDTGADPNGSVRDPTNSVYKVCFELADGSNAEGKAYFPHRGTTSGEFSNSAGKLWQQKYKSGYSGSGAVVLPANTSYITTRFDAGGDNDDTWGYKDLFVRMALVDAVQPTLYNNSASAIAVSHGPHRRGNYFYISVPFSEIVSSVGSSKRLDTTWGPAEYHSGDGSNVITFRGTVNAAAGTTLAITNCLCNFTDLSGNYFQGSLTKTFSGTTVAASYAYPITYDLAGGTLPSNAPTNYTYDAAVPLVHPTRPGYTFDGWSGTGISGLSSSVTIPAHSHGDRAYTAHWTPVTYTVHFDANGGAGAMPDLTFTYDVPQSLTSNAFTRTGYTFAGWGCDGATFADGATVQNLTNESATVTLAATWRIHIPYIDANGAERLCTDYAVLTNAAGNVGYDGGWYVVATNVTVGGKLSFYGDAHLILCDGATLAVPNANGNAIRGSNLFIYGQTNGTGTVTANADYGIYVAYGVTINGGTITATGGGTGIYAFGGITINGGTVTATGDYGIYAGDNVAINGGTVTATGDYGIYAGDNVTINGGAVIATGGDSGIYAIYDDISLGWTDPSDSIYASSYGGSAYVKPGQRLTDGSGIYGGRYIDVSVIAGKTLRPAYHITLPEGVVASGVVTQNGTDAYALPGATVTLSAALPGSAIGNVTVNGEAVAPVDGIYSFTASAASITVDATVGVPYIDADGTEQLCTDYTVLTNATGDVEYDGGWYVVATNVTVGGNLFFYGDANLILCDGATLAVTNANGTAIDACLSLAIYGQTNGTGTVTAIGESGYGICADGRVTINGGIASATGDSGISAAGGVAINGGTVTATGESMEGICTHDDVTINGGTVTASGEYSVGINAGDVTINGGTVTATGGYYGIYAIYDDISLGWTDPSDSIYASSYGGSAYVKPGQRLTDGSGIYGVRYIDVSVIAGKTLRPAYHITLPEGVVASGVVTQNGTEAYALPDATVTLSAALPGNAIGNVTVNGEAVAPVDGIYSFTASAASITVTATVCIPVPYIDEDGTEQMCASYTVLTNAAGGVTYGGGSGWYVVTNAVIISGKLNFSGTARLILCDGATLAVTNEYSSAIEASSLAIYGQTNGTGTVTAEGGYNGIYANNGSVTINGGTVTANGGTDGIHAGYNGSVTITGGTVTANGDRYGIYAANGSVTINGGTVTANFGSTGIYAGGFITLGWTNPTDSITASSYSARIVYVKTDQTLTDGNAIYESGPNPTLSALKGKTLRPAYSITLPAGVVAGSVVTQDGTTAYAIAGTNVTLSAAAPGYVLGNVTINGEAIAPVGGVYSFTASADVTIAATVTPIAYSVRFDANGGEGSMPDQSFTYGEPQALSSNAFTRTGYAFAGWSVAGTTYPDGATVLNLTNAQDAVVSLVAKWGIPVPYIDADGTERLCADYIVLTNAAGGVTYGANGEESWYVVTNAVTISGRLYFRGTAHLILCDGATLAVTNEVGDAIDANGGLTIYGQASGTGSITPYGYDYAIFVVGDFTVNGGNATAKGDYCAIQTANSETADGGIVINRGNLNIDGCVVASGDFTMNGSRFVASTASEDYSAIHSYSSIVVNGGTLVANHDEAIGMYAWGSIVLGWTNVTDRITISSCYAGNSVYVREGQSLTDGTDIYEDEIDHGDIAGKALRPYVQPSSFKDPEGAVIDDPNVLSWLSNNGFTQDDIDRLGSDAAATEKLYECCLVNCDLKVQGAGGTLSLTGIAVTNGVVSVTVQLVRTAPLGVINGVLSLYGTSDLALGFDGGQIENESISFGEGDDPGFDTEKSTDSVSQSVTATFDVSLVTDKFFKAVIQDDSLDDPDPFPEEPNPDDQDPISEDPNPDDPDPNAPEE